MEKALPHNIDAERATLGAIFLDRDAIIPLAPWLQPQHFYLEAHAWIYEAQLASYHRRTPPDLTTVADELRRTERLDQVGGIPFLVELANGVPTAFHVEYYARIVERTAVLRRLIQAGAKITALGYDESDDVEQTLDAAEREIFNVSQRRGLQDFVALHEIVDQYYEYLSEVQERGPEMTGLPTGFVDFDRITGGLHASDLIILAARPGVGKSSLAMSIAFNVAIQQQTPVGIFSLEMGRDQLLHRLLATHTGIDSQKLRVGRLSTSELQALMDAMGQLSATPIYIDDTPGLTISEVRSKGRRLQAEHGLGLLIVDYLQLMSGSGRRNDNRVQEVSEISRSLKGLARELNTPVIALSQLSRAVEGRTSHVPVLADLRESGCLTGDTSVYLPDQGIYRPIAELVGQHGFNVLALNTETWKLTTRPVLKAFATGRKPVYRLTTRLGRSIRATANHKFRTMEGWRRLDELISGMHIALPRHLPGPEQSTMSYSELALLAHLIGDGCTLPRHIVQYTTHDETLAQTVVGLANEVFGHTIAPYVQREQQWYQQSIGMTSRQMQAALGNAYCGTGLYKQNLGRERAARLAKVVQCAELRALAHSDVYWDQIISITPEGEEEVYDLTVDELHNFVADNIIVHNSIEQDADLVMFIYREELYDKDTDKKGIAEIHIAKHRNGPLGMINLFFDQRTTRFRDLAPYQAPEGY